MLNCQILSKKGANIVEKSRSTRSILSIYFHASLSAIFTQNVSVQPSHTKCNTYNSKCLSRWGSPVQIWYISGSLPFGNPWSSSLNIEGLTVLLTVSKYTLAWHVCQIGLSYLWNLWKSWICNTFYTIHYSVCGGSLLHLLCQPWREQVWRPLLYRMMENSLSTSPQWVASVERCTQVGRLFSLSDTFLYHMAAWNRRRYRCHYVVVSGNLSE